MCKILTIAGLTPEVNTTAMAFIKEMARLMSQSNTDGMGYAALTKDGEMFGERWLYNRDAFKRRPTLAEKVTSKEQEVLDLYSELLKPSYERGSSSAAMNNSKKMIYDTFGDVKMVTDKTHASMSAITLHARLATTERGFANVHPFVLNGTSVIHNGQISNYKEIGIEQSTCDSESILNLYTAFDVVKEPGNIQLVSDGLEGSFACAAFGKIKDKTYILDLFKNVSTNLHAAYIDELQAMVYATMASDIVDACKKLDLTIIKAFEFHDNRMLRINPITGAPMIYVDFKREFSFGKHYNSGYNNNSHHHSDGWTRHNKTFHRNNNDNIAAGRFKDWRKKQGKDDLVSETDWSKDNTKKTLIETESQEIGNKIKETESILGKLEKRSTDVDMKKIEASQDGWMETEDHIWVKVS